MRTDFYYRPAIPLVIAYICGIALGDLWPGFAPPALALAGASGTSVIFRLVRPKTALYSPLLLLAALGYLAIQPWLVPRLPLHHISHFVRPAHWIIIGEVAGTPYPHHRGLRFDLETGTLRDTPGDSTARTVSGRLRVTLSGEVRNLRAGDTIQFRAAIKPIRNYNNPGGFDFRRYMAFKRIHNTCWVSERQTRNLKILARPETRPDLSRTRPQLAAFIDRHAVGTDAAAVLKALLIGDRSGIESDLRTAFARAGVGHMLAISGLHMGIVATVLFMVALRLASFIPWLLWRAWTRKAAALAAIIGVLGYGLVAGMAPSTQRAVIMVATFLLTWWVGREQDSANSLALAALAILILHPPNLFSISFQLSFSAVGTIIYGLSCTTPIVQKHSRRNNGRKPITRTATVARALRRWVLLSSWVSLLAILGTLPLAMYYFNLVSTIGLIANLVIVPLVGFGVLPLGLVAVVAYLAQLEIVAGLLIWTGSFILLPCLAFIQNLARLPFAAFVTFTPGIIELICYYCLGAVVLATLKRRLADPPPPGASIRPYVKRPLIWISAAAMLVLAADTGYWLYQRFWRTDLRVTFLDVGHGNATVAQLPKGRVLVIDGGGFADNTIFDVGQRIVAPYLWRNKIMTVDTLILSHPNSDHLNGLIYLARIFNVKQLWSNGEPAFTQGYRQLTTEIAAQEIDTPPYATLKGDHIINGVNVSIVYPPTDFLARGAAERWRNTNNNSLVVRLQFGDHSFLIPGDIMADAEAELVQMAGERLPCTVLAAPHHGSRSSSTELFLQRAAPRWIVVSARPRSRRQLPHPAVLRRYAAHGGRVLRTDRNGALTFTTDGSKLTVHTALPMAEAPATGS